MSARRRRSRRNAWLIAGAVAVSAVLLLLAVGAYPLAIVNGRVIWASTFRAYVASALAYQQAARDTYGSTSTPLLAASARGETALGAAALDELLAQELIAQGLEELVGENAPRLGDQKLADLQDQAGLSGAARALFQLDPAAFTDAILRPQAEREVLAGRLFIEGATLEDWVAARRKEARVRLLTGSYRWDGERVLPE
jgi:hypothetical protein